MRYQAAPQPHGSDLLRRIRHLSAKGAMRTSPVSEAAICETLAELGAEHGEVLKALTSILGKQAALQAEDRANLKVKLDRWAGMGRESAEAVYRASSLLSQEKPDMLRS
jgi:hypothetical protein